MGKAGIVLGLEVSRLARNNADWHRLLEICALTDTLILDEDGLYHPGEFNDRLLLGLKGTMSEAELHFIRARLRGGQLSKARRGELKIALPVGLVHDPAGRVVLDPDTGVRDAVAHLFTVFHRTGSARAVVKEFTDAGLLFPVRVRTGTHKGELVWMPLQHWRVLRILHNPRYAGAFVYGRRRGARTPSGKTDRHHRAPRGMVRADPRRAPRLPELRTIRGQPAVAAGQRPGPRHRPAAPARRGKAPPCCRAWRSARAADNG